MVFIDWRFYIQVHHSAAVIAGKTTSQSSEEPEMESDPVDDPRPRLKRKPVKCPKCGHRPVADIVYGFPAFPDKLEPELSEGRIILGGCCISPGYDPAWQCSSCGWQGWPVQRLSE
jgi:hypothetical protein